MDQIPEGAELANAKLLQRPSGYYLLQTCFVDDRKPAVMSVDNAIGIDFGITDTITTSDGEKMDISVGETNRLKGLQRKMARQMKEKSIFHL